MNTFKVYKTSEKYEFTLKTNHYLILVNLRCYDGIWHSKMYAGDHLGHYWSELFMEEKGVKVKYNVLKVGTEDEDEIINGLYELVTIIKKHPEYRLRVLNLLEKDVRQIWNIV